MQVIKHTKPHKASLRLRPELDANVVRVFNVPDEVVVGVYQGYSLPVYSADNEELYLRQHVPRRWDGESDITLGVIAALATANTSKKFRLNLAWEHFAKDGVVPTTSNPVSVEIDTGTALEHQSWECEFTIDYDIDGAGSEIKDCEVLSARLRRGTASANDISGEVIILDWYTEYIRDKLGKPV